MIGLLFGIADLRYDPKGNDVIVGIKPFLHTHQVASWLGDLAEQSDNSLN
jgi:hypothetical protein